MRERSTIATADGDIAYTDVGDGPVTLFIHGVFLNADLWGPAIDLVASGRRCVAVDLPGHGATRSRARADFSLPALADAVDRFCDALGLDAADVVANDTGGAVAQVLAVRHRNRVRTLSLTNCDVSDNLPPEAFKPIVALAERGELGVAATLMLSDFDFARSDAGLGVGFEGQLDDATIRTFLEGCAGTPEKVRELERFITSLVASDLVAIEPDLRMLDAPTLVVWGTADVFFDLSWAYWLRDTIPGVTEVVEIEGAKLFFPFERAPELVAALQRHWAAAGSPSARR